MKYALFGKFKVEEKDKDTLSKILQDAAVILEGNEDCLHYLVSETEVTDEVWVWEAWNTQQAHDDSLKDEELLNLIMQAKPLIKDVPPSTELTILGGKGL